MKVPDEVKSAQRQNGKSLRKNLIWWAEKKKKEKEEKC